MLALSCSICCPIVFRSRAIDSGDGADSSVAVAIAGVAAAITGVGAAITGVGAATAGVAAFEG